MRRERIVFVWLNHNMHLSYGHGVGILVAVAKKAGAEVFVHHVHSDLGNPPIVEKVTSDILDLQPSVVGISSSTLEREFAKDLAQKLKAMSTKKPLLVLGGSHPTFCESEEGYEFFDYVIIGEGEQPIIDLVNGKIFGQKKIVGDIIPDLDFLPFSDRDSFAMQKIIDSRNGIVDFISQRGCPYNCSYCSNHFLRKLYGKDFLRRRSVKNVISEVKNIISRFRCKIIFFHDDIFTLNEDWTKEFCSRYKKEVNLPWIINSHVNHLSDGIITALHDAGCIEIKIGVETGDEDLRASVLNKKINDDKIIGRFSALQEKIRSYAFMMQGLPKEKDVHYEKSVALMAKILPNVIRQTIFYPLPNTSLGDSFYKKDVRLMSSMLGDSPSVVVGKKDQVLSNFYRFGWQINKLLGLDEYNVLIKRHSDGGNLDIRKIKKDDEEISSRLTAEGKIHYSFSGECSMLKLRDGTKSPF